ncbi:MAG: Nitrogen regulation protein NR(I) [Deltaproteobacteria bacterium ADurb.BinA179]|jgi:DNA-binding NtrC family response regulator|nr:sigma-54-dependent Fis family transcriptional regulator [Deltaproteobacteria bacterium]MDI9542049.1 sigma-54 dependent transcriptional regulator [Pseudomonadota bacterium]NLW68046.1 sigma-54-dependent Fis family transcriptional regulator [Bacteriovoracaceae bacterium]OPZ29288.1 MAG: Nitrogen regulation protein NR(I) [Deltaproteobacteria bacterium ADurb.BinA179]HRR21963.1 sigma-54 dependent transcriptional regulator [Desulfomonilia bacterium]
MVQFSLVVIDDEKTIRDGIEAALKSEYAVRSFAAAEEAIDEIKTSPPDLVLLDIGLPGMDGIEALTKIKELYPDVLVIMITAFEDAKTVISAMKLGAYDYVLKPIVMGGLRVTIKNALETIRLRKEVKVLQENYLKENIPFFIAQSNKIQEIMDFITKAAQSADAPILILGETGTGKELIARAIHCRSPNFKGPFLTLNCAAIPKDLIESELFGYEKGAFSGAEPSGKKGIIEAAADGTLFLDEVGDLSPQAQAKLLRFLENGEFYRVGSSQKRHIRTRIVSATNKDLSAMMDEGTFRHDLYFRLGVVTVHIPSLNERREDVIPLAQHFLVLYSAKYHKQFTSISKEAVKALQEHHWVGNVRELRNIIERGVLIGRGPELKLEDMGMSMGGRTETGGRAAGEIFPDEEPLIPPEGFDLMKAIEEYERRYIKAALKYAEGNESRAARLLHMNHCTFRYQRKKIL